MRYWKMIVAVVVILSALIGGKLVSYNRKVVLESIPSDSGTATTSPKATRTVFVLPEENISSREQEEIAMFTDSVVINLRDKDFSKFATKIHPEKGLIVSPYQYVSTSTDPHFATSSVFLAQVHSTSTRQWGTQDGSGEPIYGTFSKFYSDWLFEYDYTQAPNLRIFRKFTSISAEFPLARIVQYEYPGFEEKYGGMDWSGLIVGIEKYNGEWYVVLLAHAQWMI